MPCTEQKSGSRTKDGRESRIKAQALAEEVTTLISLPEVTVKLTQLLDSPLSTNTDIGEVIINDPALAAQVLKLANSPLYTKMPCQIDMVSRAVAMIGRESVRDLVLTASVTSSFQGIPPELADMERFWLNSVACGVIARSLAFRARIFQSEPMFVAGLLHKVGRLVFYSCRPKQYRRILEVCAGQDEAAINRAELETFGFTHAELGGELLGKWNLPEQLQAAVTHYPAPNLAPRYKRSAAFIHVASPLAGTIEPGMKTRGTLYREKLGFETGAWQMLKLPLDVIPQVLDEALMQAFEIFNLVRPAPF